MLGLAKDINKIEVQAKNAMNKHAADKNIQAQLKNGVEYVRKGSNGQDRIVAFPSLQSKTGFVVRNPDDNNFYEFDTSGYSKFNPAAVEMDLANRIDPDKIKIRKVFMPERFDETQDFISSFVDLPTYDKPLENNKTKCWV